MSIHISCDMYLRLGLHVQIRLYYVLPFSAKISAQHGICFMLDRCIVYLGLTMPNLQKKRPLIFEIFNIKKCTVFFGNRVYITSYSWQSSSQNERLCSVLPVVLLYVIVCSTLSFSPFPWPNRYPGTVENPVPSFCMSRFVKPYHSHLFCDKTGSQTLFKAHFLPYVRLLIYVETLSFYPSL